MRVSVIALTAAAILAGASTVRADDVTDQINEALVAYQKKDIPTAVAALDAAANLLRQARADVFRKLLPEPAAGWEADEPEVNVLPAVAMGVGSTVSRRYRKDDDQVTLEISVDGPMVQGMGAMLNSPMLAATGAKQVVIGGKRMAFIKDDNAYFMLVANRVLVKVSGSRGTPDAALRAYAGAVDTAALENSLR